MNLRQKQDRVKRTIRVLSVLLVLSLCALAVTLVRKGWFCSGSTTVTVPDNHITTGASVVSREIPRLTAGGDTATLKLTARRPQDNVPFSVGNMFPGDSVTQNYQVKVTGSHRVKLHFHADVRSGYEKLAEVLQMKVVLTSTGASLYEGLMRDMPESLIQELDGTAEVRYEITAWLDTSVGNEYQYQELVADFRWWLEDVEQGGGSDGENQGQESSSGHRGSGSGSDTRSAGGARTGDTARPLFWLLTAVLAAGISLWCIRRGKEEKKHE